MEHRVFCLRHLKHLVDEELFADADSYISQYFFKSGANIYFRNGYKSEFILYKDTDAIKLLPDDLVVYNKKLEVYNAKKYLKGTEFKMLEYNPTIDFSTEDVKFTKTNRSGIPVNYLNMAKPKPSFETIEADRSQFKEDLEFVYQHLLTVWANDNDDVYEWILNFLACSMTGKRKLRQCLYLPCNQERAGRGSILNFINAIVGERMYKTCSVEELLKYNKNFEGRSLINFDELPTDKGNFKSISDTMKAYITEPTFPCRDMYNKPYEQKNTFNVIITSNNEAIHITQSNNERYMICTINTCRVGQHAYFSKLNKILQKPEVQKLFYEDMEARVGTCKSWNEDIKPHSSAKQEKLIETLPRVLKYIKEHFVLKGKGIDMKTTDFFSMYYTATSDKTSKQKINRELKKVNLVSCKIRRGETTFNYYSISPDELFEQYQKKGFIDDELECVENDEEYDENDQQAVINDLQKQLEEMKSKYEALLKSQQPKRKFVIKKKKPTPTPPIKVKDIRKEAMDSVDEDDLSILL